MNQQIPKFDSFDKGNPLEEIKEADID